MEICHMKKSGTNKETPKLTNDKEELKFNILETVKCKTLSGKSNITYQIISDANKTVSIRIKSNDGGGYYSDEAITIDAIIATLSALPDDKPITSIHLFKLFSGKSSNNGGFLLCALLNEKMLKPFEGKQRQYAFIGADTLLTKIAKLMKKK